MRISIFILIITTILFITSCADNIVVQPPIASVCNSTLSNCVANQNTEYCTFGYKWGKYNPFLKAGYQIPGPASGGIEISYKFQDAGFRFNTHSQNNVESASIKRISPFAEIIIRNAFAQWEANTDIKFVEKFGKDSTDIKVITADITQGGLGYPPVPKGPCAGLVIFRCTSYSYLSLQILALHEIGHVLGLGHVSSGNVMNPDKGYYYLQSGDIKGIQSIYGKR
jgi:Matrixin